jgi:hypothetical protein
MRAGSVDDLPSDDQKHCRCVCRLALCSRSSSAVVIRLTMLSPLLLLAANAWAGQAEAMNPASALPDAPLPLITLEGSRNSPCRVVPKSEFAGAALTTAGGSAATSLAGAAPDAGTSRATTPDLPPPCSPPTSDNFFQRFVNGPEAKPSHPGKKQAWLSETSLTPSMPSPFSAPLPSPSDRTLIPLTALDWAGSLATSASATHKT